MTAPPWMPLQNAIVPLSQAPGPLQMAERLAAQRRRLDDALLEYGLRHLGAVEAILSDIIPTLTGQRGESDQLLLASARVLEGRLRWRMKQPTAGHLAGYIAPEQSREERDAYDEALQLFNRHEKNIPRQPGATRLYTDYGIALHRIGQHADALSQLDKAVASGAAPAEAFGYAGMARVALGRPEEAIVCLEKGLEIAPTDTALLTTYAITLDGAGAEYHAEAVQMYCQAAISAGGSDNSDAARDLLEAALAVHADDPRALSMYVLLLRSQGDIDTAIQRLRQVLATSEANPWALGLYGMMLREQGNTAEAIQAFEKIRVGDRDLAWVLLEHARTIASKDVAAARRMVADAAGYRGQDDTWVMRTKTQVEVQAALAGVAPVGRIALGLFDRLVEGAGDVLQKYLPQMILSLTRAASSEDPAQTISTLTALLGLWPDHIQAREELVRRLLEQNELDKAEETLRQGLKNDPESPRLIGLQGQLLETRGKIPEAIREYRRAARAAPEDDQQSDLLVSALVRAGRQDDALFELRSRLDARPNDARALARRGWLLRNRQDFQKARLDLETAERLLVSSGDEAAAADLLNVRNNLGQTLGALDRFDEAIEVFDRAISVDRTSPFDARSLKASILLDTAEYQAAADLLAETIRLLSATKNDAATTRLGWLYHRRGWALQCSGGGGPAEVEQSYRTAIKLSPNHDYAKKELASLLIHSRRPDARREGETRLVELTERTRGRSLPLQLLGWCHFLRHRDEAAEQWLRAALPPGPGNVETMVTDAEIECRFDLALVLLAARPEDGQTKAEYDTVIAQARRRPPPRRRGLLYVALQDLVEAASVDRINPDFGRAQWGKLRSELDTVNYPAERLERLRYP